MLGLHRLCQDQGDKCEINVRQDLFCFSSLGHKVLCKDVFMLHEILVLRSVNIKGMSQNKNRTLQFWAVVQWSVCTVLLEQSFSRLPLVLQNKGQAVGWWEVGVFQAGYCRGGHCLEADPDNSVFHWGIIFITYYIWRMNYVFLLFHLVFWWGMYSHLNLFCLFKHTLWLKGC